MPNIPIFLASDNNYAPFVATTIASICDNTKSFCEFYILDGGISQENKDKICQLKKQFSNFAIEFLKVDIEKEFATINYNNHGKWISISTYNRFLIPQLKPEIDRALYSDVDVIVLGDIAQMYNEDLEGYALGAVWEEYLENALNITRKQRLKLSPNHKYFSAGNLLIDCKKWREDNITQKLFEVETINRDKLTQADMDVLNIFFDTCYKQLSPKYCWLNRCSEFYKDDTKIVIRHYCSEIKPWHIHPDIEAPDKYVNLPDVSVFWHYAKMTDFFDEIVRNCKFKSKRDLYKYRVFNLMKQKKEGTI